MNELHDLLDLVTDRVASPDLAARALTRARRRRTAHRSVLAAGVAASILVGVAYVGEVSRHEGGSTPPVTPSTTSPTGTAHATLADITQPMWNPRDVECRPGRARRRPRPA